PELPGYPTSGSRRCPSAPARSPRLLPASRIRESPDLEGGKREQRAQNAQEVEPGHDLGLGPSQLLEMVVQRRHAEDAVIVRVLLAAGPLPVLVDRGLNQHRRGL